MDGPDASAEVRRDLGALSDTPGDESSDAVPSDADEDRDFEDVPHSTDSRLSDSVVSTDQDADLTDQLGDSDQVDQVEVLYEPNIRVGFQYVGDNGGSHYLDDIVITGADSELVIDEGFEGGELPEGWLRRIRRGFYTWEIHYGSGEAHSGEYSAKVTWYQEQDEWLVSPPLEADGPFALFFWNKGSVGLAEAATLHVHYTCTDGYQWHELYAFPGTAETESYVWYHNQLAFDCP